MNNGNFIKKSLTAFALIVVILVVVINLYRRSHVTIQVPQDNSGGMEVDKDTKTIHLKTLPPATAEDKG